MRPPDLEAIVPGLRECREAEHFHRAAAFAGLTWTIAGCEVVPLTPRHRLEFQLTRNAFTIGLPPQRGDLLQFLWRLNPAFRRNKWSSVATLFAYARVWLAVAFCNRRTVARDIHLFTRAMLQDMPEARGNAGENAAAKDTAKYIHWIGGDAAFFLTRFAGFSIETYMDTPLLALQQLIRAWRVANEPDADFINESDRVIGRWRNEIMAQAKARGGSN